MIVSDLHTAHTLWTVIAHYRCFRAADAHGEGRECRLTYNLVSFHLRRSARGAPGYQGEEREPEGSLSG